MKNSSPTSQRKLLEKVKNRALALKAERQAKETPKKADEFINLKLVKAQARFKQTEGYGEFFIKVDVKANKEAVYVPLSVASSQKPTGYVYHIEGTGGADIKEADITCRGDGVTKVTLGTLLYTKIPAGQTGSFRMLIHIWGDHGKKYQINIHRINYKLAPQDPRYRRFKTKLSTPMVKFT